MKTKTDFSIVTTHSKRSTSGTKFNLILNKFMLSGMVLAATLGIASPVASAAGFSIGPVPNQGNTNTVNETYGVSTDNAISNLKSTLDNIKTLQNTNTVTNSSLQKLSSQLFQLETAAKGNVTNAVSDVVLEVESALGGLSDVNTFEAVAAVSTVKRNLGITSNEVGSVYAVAQQKAAPSKVTSFTDVDKGYWGYNDIFTIVNKKAIEGTSPVVNGVGTFSPNGEVSLGQFLAIATRLVAPDKIVENTSGNITHWALKNYNAAVQIGLINPEEFSSDDASLNKSLTREDMAYLLVNLATVNGEKLTKKANIENNISDLSKISKNRKSAVLLSYSNGLLQGTGSSFSPHNTTKRSEIAAVFCRVMNYTPRPSVVVKEDAETMPTYFVGADGDENEGLLRSVYCKQYDTQFLQAARFTKNAKGEVVLTVTAPVLPKEIVDAGCKFEIHVTYKNKDKNVNKDFTGYEQMGDVVLIGSGETKSFTFNSYNTNQLLKASEITKADLCVNIANPTTELGSGRYMQTHTVSSNMKSVILSEYWDRSDIEKINFDSSAIFKGLGL